MYLIKLDSNNQVIEIVKNPTKEQKSEGIVLESLSIKGQFYKVDEKIYYNKKENE